jgi:prepilin-type N-terminal cleavage/methylation domain-containing protein
MTSATGDAFPLRPPGLALLESAAPAAARERRRAGGFTLLEILAVLALVGLISSLLLGGGEALLRAMAKDDIETVALEAVAGARRSAVISGRQLELHYDEKTRQLDWAVGRVGLTGEGELRLLPPKLISAMVLGGEMVETPLARVRFYADGTCDPFRLEFVRGKISRTLLIDPWTCTVLSSGATAGPY